MTSLDTAALVVTGVAVVLAGLLVGVFVSHRRTRRELAHTLAQHEDLLTRISVLERPEVARAPESTVEFVITDVDSSRAAPAQGRHPQETPGRIEGRLFADIVVRETVVKAASWTHGLRHALSAENRNRLRFEMRRETKRAGRQRKADVKEALRQYYARERGDVA